MTTLKFETRHYYGEVCPDSYRGWFEHQKYGDECGGGLWFEGKNLIDYDGTASLPKEVIQAIRNFGFYVGEEFE